MGGRRAVEELGVIHGGDPHKFRRQAGEPTALDRLLPFDYPIK